MGKVEDRFSLITNQVNRSFLPKKLAWPNTWLKFEADNEVSEGTNGVERGKENKVMDVLSKLASSSSVEAHIIQKTRTTSFLKKPKWAN